jgi:hypothetical protein
MSSFVLWAQCGSCNSHDSKGKTEVKSEMKTLAGYNKVNWIDENHYFTYSFDKKPKIGVSILKVKVYDKSKKLVNIFDVFANADMPSMKGAHSSGDVKLKANKKGELLIPINFVMPGEWLVEMKFKKGGAQVFCGCFGVKI